VQPLCCRRSASSFNADATPLEQTRVSGGGGTHPRSRHTQGEALIVHEACHAQSRTIALDSALFHQD
jgi:hypothetical protein